MKGFTLLAVLIFLIALSACVSPKVKYMKLESRDVEGYIKFRLVGSNILISTVNTTLAGKKFLDASTFEEVTDASEIQASVVPREQKPDLYAVVPKSQWLGTVETKLHATFYTNTQIINILGTKLEDNRIKLIQAMGAAAKAAVVPFRPQLPAIKIRLPVVINPDDVTSGIWQQLPSNLEWIFKLQFDRDNQQKEDPDVIPVDEFFKEYNNSDWFNSTSVFPISACMSAALTLVNLDIYRVGEIIVQDPKHNNEQDNDYVKRLKLLIEEFIEQTIIVNNTKRLLFTLQIANPKFVRTVRMPDAGTVTTHTVCGADTKTEATNAATTYDLVSELIKQAQAVYEAQNKK